MDIGDYQHLSAVKRAQAGRGLGSAAGIGGMFNLFNAASDFADKQGLQIREEKIAKAIADAGGDPAAVSDDLVKDRRGVQAFGSVLDTMSKSKAAQVAINKFSDSLAEDTMKGLGASMRLAQEAIAAGDHARAAQYLETGTAYAKVPYKFKYNQDTGQIDMFHTDLTTGQDVAMGRSMPVDGAIKEVGNLLQDSSKFRSEFARHYRTVLQSNIDNLKNPDNDLVAKAKDGKDTYFTPIYRMQAGQMPEIVYKRRDGGEMFTAAELHEAGFGALQSKKGNLANEKQELAAQRAANQAEYQQGQLAVSQGRLANQADRNELSAFAATQKAYQDQVRQNAAALASSIGAKLDAQGNFIKKDPDTGEQVELPSDVVANIYSRARAQADKTLRTSLSTKMQPFLPKQEDVTEQPPQAHPFAAIAAQFTRR